MKESNVFLPCPECGGDAVCVSLDALDDAGDLMLDDSRGSEVLAFECTACDFGFTQTVDEVLHPGTP